MLGYGRRFVPDCGTGLGSSAVQRRPVLVFEAAPAGVAHGILLIF